jgi:ribosomal-protein-alanine N-acetyltransferase
MTTQIQLRPAAPTDLNAILALERATATAPHWPLSSYAANLDANLDAFQQRIIAPQRLLLVADHDALLVGFAVAFVTPGERDAACIAELESIAVASAARRAGLGRALCSAVLAWCRSNGATEVVLEVRAAGTGAIALYAGLGFTETARRPRYYHNPEDDALLMRLALVDRPGSPPDPAGAAA